MAVDVDGYLEAAAEIVGACGSQHADERLDYARVGDDPDQVHLVARARTRARAHVQLARRKGKTQTTTGIDKTDTRNEIDGRSGGDVYDSWCVRRRTCT